MKIYINFPILPNSFSCSPQVTQSEAAVYNIKPSESDRDVIGVFKSKPKIVKFSSFQVQVYLFAPLLLTILIIT